MRSLLFGVLLFASACIDNERDPFIGSYNTTWSTTIVRTDGSSLAFASSEAYVLVGENGDDNSLEVKVFANHGANVDCSFYVVATGDTLVPDPSYGSGRECLVCDELRADCWHLDLVSATGTLVGEQLTVTSSFDAQRSGQLVDEGTATATLAGQRTY